MPTREYVNCDICGLDDTELLYSVPEFTGTYLETFNLVECKKCGLVYVNPRPRIQEIQKYYPKEIYYAYQEVQTQISLRNRIKNFLLEWAGGYRETNKSLLWLFRKIAKSALIGIIPYRANGRLLDIGCGNGSFLTWCKEHGWNVHGVEINKKAAQLCREKGIDVFEGEFIDTRFPSETFDAITLTQTLEHLPNPSATIREVHRILKEDGLLMIGIPNFGCFDRKILGRSWLPLEVPRHLYHFKLKTIEKLLGNNRFEIEEIRAKGFYLLGIRNLRLLRNETFINFVRSIIILVVLKPILLILSRRRKERFGVLISLHCRKVPA